MAKSRPLPANPPLKIPTIQNDKLGLPIFQIPLPPASPPEPVAPDLGKPVVNFPSQKYAEWSFETSRDLSLREITSTRRFDLFLFSLFAQQWYLAVDDNLPTVRFILPGLDYQARSSITPAGFRWDEYLHNGTRMLVFGGSADPGFHANTPTPTLVGYAGQPDSVKFYAKYKDYFLAAEEAIWSQYSALLSAGQPSFLFAGHDLGGALATWLAYRLNQRAPLVEGGTKPVFCVYTYGAPAVWVDTSETIDFCQDNKNYASVNTFDAAPGIVQELLRRSPYWTAAPANQKWLPQVYRTRDYWLTRGENVWTYLRSSAQSYLDNRGDPAFVARYFRHRPGHYAALLADHCKEEKDTPFREFRWAQDWFDLMAVQGHPTRPALS